MNADAVTQHPALSLSRSARDWRNIPHYRTQRSDCAHASLFTLVALIAFVTLVRVVLRRHTPRSAAQEGHQARLQLRLQGRQALHVPPVCVVLQRGAGHHRRQRHSQRGEPAAQGTAGAGGPGRCHTRPLRAPCLHILPRPRPHPTRRLAAHPSSAAAATSALRSRGARNVCAWRNAPAPALLRTSKARAAAHTARGSTCATGEGAPRVGLHGYSRRRPRPLAVRTL